MSENAEADYAEGVPQEDLLVDDVPIVAPTAHPRRHMSAGDVGALALALLLHLAAGAAVLHWAMFNRPASLIVQAGTGTSDFGSGVNGGQGIRDSQAELPGNSAAGTQTAVSVPTQLPDLKTDATMAVVEHDVGEMLPQTDSPLLQPIGPPVTGLTAPLRNRPPALAMATAAASSSVMPAEDTRAAVPEAGQRGVGGSGVNGAGGGAGRNGSGAPTGMPGNRPPVYPPAEFRRGVTGTVKLRIIILQDGETGDVSVAESSGVPALDASAVSAARSWRWSPVMEDGQRVRAEVIKPVIFEIHDRSHG